MYWHRLKESRSWIFFSLFFCKIPGFSVFRVELSSSFPASFQIQVLSAIDSSSIYSRLAQPLSIQGATYTRAHGLWTHNEAFFHGNPKRLGLGGQFGQINFGAIGVFSADLSAPIWYSESLVHVFHYSTIISKKKTKHLCPHPKYLFGIGI